MQIPKYTEISQKILLDDIFWKNLKHEKVPNQHFESKIREIS